MRSRGVLTIASDPDDDGFQPAGSVQELWEHYRSTRDRDARDRLILQYAPLVKLVAGRVGRRLPANVEAADLTSWGMIGLIDAIDKFDLDRGVRFEAYASRRIHGAILDEMRATDWVPRAVRRNTRAIDDARARLERTLHRTPSRAEVARELGTDEARLARMLAEESLTHVEPLATVSGSGRNVGTERRAREAAADSSGNPDAVSEQMELDRALTDAIGMLPERERLIVVLSYYEGLTLADIGATLQITESRVCQLRSGAIAKLRRHLAGPPSWSSASCGPVLRAG